MKSKAFAGPVPVNSGYFTKPRQSKTPYTPQATRGTASNPEMKKGIQQPFEVRDVKSEVGYKPTNPPTGARSSVPARYGAKKP